MLQIKFIHTTLLVACVSWNSVFDIIRLRKRNDRSGKHTEYHECSGVHCCALGVLCVPCLCPCLLAQFSNVYEPYSPPEPLAED